MQRHPFAAIVVAYFAFLLLAGCALTQSFSGQVAAGYAAVAATNDTATVLVNAGTITKADGAAVLEKTRTARLAIDAANAAKDGTALEKALAVLNQAQIELCKGHEADPNCVLLAQQGARP